ncbi:MAG: hypothetical protein IJS08_03850 [Victivallales bacterium]|nr:hypothetical protein [Victivallales bacterium]
MIVRMDSAFSAGKSFNQQIAGRDCHIYEQEMPLCILVQPLGVHEQDTLDAEVQSIAAKASIPFAMVAFEISDWERDLMPWSDPAVSKLSDAECHADETLRYITDELLPWLKGRFGDLPIVLGGYSLAGLFSLWAARECDCFYGIAAASPSVWIEGWPDYVDTHPMRARRVFLSLGEREEKTRNRAIARVGERIRDEHALLQRQLGEANCTLEWNPGGHFVDCDSRLARAFIWNLARDEKQDI